MSDTTIKVSVGGQPVAVNFDADRISVAVVNETIHVHGSGDGIRLTVKEEKLDFSSPLVLAAPGWPFGPNPNRVTGVARDVPTIVDRLAMPSYYRVAKWLLLVTNEADDLAVSSEITCMRKSDGVHFIEYAVMGDSGLLPYEIDVEDQGDEVRLILISRYAGGNLTARTSKIGIFN